MKALMATPKASSQKVFLLRSTVITALKVGLSGGLGGEIGAQLPARLDQGQGRDQREDDARRAGDHEGGPPTVGVRDETTHGHADQSPERGADRIESDRR